MAIIINNISFEPDPALNITGTLDTREGANIDSGKKISQILIGYTEHVLNHATYILGFRFKKWKSFLIYRKVFMTCRGIFSFMIYK